MRCLAIAMLFLGVTNCSPAQQKAAPAPAALDYRVAYEAAAGGFEGMSLFIDPALGETWVAFRNENEGVSKEGYGDPLAPCGQSSIGCFKPDGRPPLLSKLPPDGFLGGDFIYSARPVTVWTIPCNEISAVSARATTTSTVCGSVGLVAFTYAVLGNPVERYELKSYAGLFATR